VTALKSDNYDLAGRTLGSCCVVGPKTRRRQQCL